MTTPAAEEKPKKTLKDWQTSAASWWCPGCGDFGVLAGLQRALANLGFEHDDTAVVAGIGCSGKLSGYIKAFGYHSLHGRALPPAQAIKLANRDLNVIAVGGDGDGYGIGVGHLIHAARRNVNVTYVVMDNHVYGLTKGQVSPTSQQGFVTATTPEGSIDTPVNPLALYLSSGGTFLAQGFSGDQRGLVHILEEAINHKGFSLVNIFSPCVTFNKTNTYAWYRNALRSIDGEEIEHDPSDRAKAMQLVLNEPKKWTGILYQDKDRKPYEEQTMGGNLKPLTGLDLENQDYDKLMEHWR